MKIEEKPVDVIVADLIDVNNRVLWYQQHTGGGNYHELRDFIAENYDRHVEELRRHDQMDLADYFVRLKTRW